VAGVDISNAALTFMGRQNSALDGKVEKFRMERKENFNALSLELLNEYRRRASTT
jgi:hypothetical protein